MGNSEKGRMSGNKGEWSELYTFMKLLSQGRVYAANERVEKIDDVYYYLINGDITDPVVVYKSLDDNKGMKGMRISELEEWELVK